MPSWEGARGCSSWNCEQEVSALTIAPIPWCLPFLICEMGAGKGWKPRSGESMHGGSDEKEVEVRARSCYRGPQSEG